LAGRTAAGLGDGVVRLAGPVPGGRRVGARKLRGHRGRWYVRSMPVGISLPWALRWPTTVSAWVAPGARCVTGPPGAAGGCEGTGILHRSRAGGLGVRISPSARMVRRRSMGCIRWRGQVVVHRRGGCTPHRYVLVAQWDSAFAADRGDDRPGHGAFPTWTRMSWSCCGITRSRPSLPSHRTPTPGRSPHGPVGEAPQAVRW